jgi:predicted nucleic acid-binding protein
VAYLFDTDAISEALRPRPLRGYMAWLETIPRSEQFTSAVVMGELYRGAYRSARAEHHIRNIEERVLPSVTVLGYGTGAAMVYGRIAAELESAGLRLADADLQIAATTLRHDLELVTGNLQHFRRVPRLRICSVLAEQRRGGEEKRS